jgi:hypothetical protein
LNRSAPKPARGAGLIERAFARVAFYLRPARGAGLIERAFARVALYLMARRYGLQVSPWAPLSTISEDLMVKQFERALIALDTEESGAHTTAYASRPASAAAVIATTDAAKAKLKKTELN